jgi:dolichol-phosphate mannosyltransferase
MTGGPKLDAIELSVVIPVRNEAGNIAPLVAEIQAALAAGPSYEIIYVDDGSSDGTAAEVTRAAREFNMPVRLLRHARGVGQSGALLTGVHAARGAWIATLDGDGQNDPADIPRLWTMLHRADCDPAVRLLIGRRTRRQDTLVRRLASRIANSVRARLLKDRTADTGAGLKLFPRQLYLALPYFDHMHRFLPALVHREGAQVLSVAVNHRPRACGMSKYGIHDRLWVGLIDLAGVMWLQRRNLRPGNVIEENADGR